MGENIEHALDVKAPGATSIDRSGTFSFTASASDVPRVHGYSALEGMFFGGCIFSGRAAAGAFATISSLPCVGMVWKNS
jgi:predicted oxidoreductase